MRNQSTSINLLLVAAIGLLAAASAVAQTTSDYLITGQVRDESNQGVSGVWVFAVPEDYDQVRKAPRALSDAEGNFVIRVGRPAQYKIYPEKSAAGHFIQFSPFFRHPFVPIAEVVLRESNRTASVFVPLAPKNGALVGKVLDANTGRPVESTRFIFCLTANKKICWSTTSKTPTGEFKILVAHEPFTLKVKADGYTDWLGVNGLENESITIASGTTLNVVLYLKRQAEAVNRALNESEKQRFFHLQAPIQSSPADRVELKYFPRHTRLEWQPVEGAVSYKVEVDFCDGLVKSRRECLNPQPHSSGMNWPTQVLGTSYEFQFVGAQPGRWRVWAIDKNGQEGFKSPWWTFFHLK